MARWDRITLKDRSPLGKNGEMLTASKEHIELSRKLAGEGMVLLKNEETLPLINKKVSIFGVGQIDYVAGGGGSGYVYAPYTRNLYEGLKIKENEGKIEVFDELSLFFKEEVGKQFVDFKQGSDEGSSKEVSVPDELFDKAVNFSDVAIYVISRFSIENRDRTDKKGDYYLSDEEEALFRKIEASFEKVVVIINSGSIVDVSIFKNSKNVKGILYAWQAGTECGLATADIVVGDVNPSGKLPDTFANSFTDYPSSEHFFDSFFEVKYYEDIYVGYRYFETIPGAYDKVCYPFGYGLSYTTFDIKVDSVTEKDNRFVFDITVKNTGSVSGKEVVQIYFNAPDGKLGKAKMSLASFKKTKLLSAGEEEKLSLEVEKYYMASYDDFGKIAKSAYILEKGDYTFYVGNSVRDNQKADFVFTVKEDIIVKQLEERCIPRLLEKRLTSDGSFEEVPTFEGPLYNYPSFPTVKRVFNGKEPDKKYMLSDVAEGKVTAEDFVAQLSFEQLKSIVSGQPNAGVSNTFGIGNIEEFGIPNMLTADGPAGIRIQPHHNVLTTCWPCSTLQAATFNEAFVEECAAIAATEAEENNMAIWLAPGMNIHRTPMCGRNFEYYSEDPVLSGKIASAFVKGVQSRNIAATVKHFCCNNKEFDRMFCNSIVSERALREIYLRGFEIAICDSKPRCLMTSYNVVNEQRASESASLITDILRGEWGYDGLVMTDWHNRGKHNTEVRAGSDVRMPDGLPNNLGNGPESLASLRSAALNVV